jgi:hypothetical protein
VPFPLEGVRTGWHHYLLTPCRNKKGFFEAKYVNKVFYERLGEDVENMEAVSDTGRSKEIASIAIRGIHDQMTGSIDTF